MPIETFLRQMPKVELHVHLEGSIRPETLLQLAQRHRISLPADSLEGLRQWYQFTDFPHFAEVYFAISSCIQIPDDIELITCEFLRHQAAQNIVHSEVTYTPLTIFKKSGILFHDQLAAINRARLWGEKTLGISMTLTIDMSRELVTEEESLTVADWAISGLGNGVTGFGLGGYEVGFPPERFKKAFDRARAAGLASLPHAGETLGAESIWGSLRSLHAQRIGHGVRCIDDRDLIKELRDRQIPLEVCPTSNVCLKVVPNLSDHMLPSLIDEGLYITINSDDPPMFNTTLNDEYCRLARAFGFSIEIFEQFALNALRASLLPDNKRQSLEEKFKNEFLSLRIQNN